MFNPNKMSKVIITGPKHIQEKVISQLYNLKILHVVEHSKSDLADIGEPSEKSSKLSEVLVSVRSLISQLGIKKGANNHESGGFSQITIETKKLGDGLKKLSEDLKLASDSISLKESVKRELDLLKGINVPIQSFTSYRSLAYFTGFLKNENKLGILRTELAEVTDRFLLFESNVKNRIFIALFIDMNFKETANKILQKGSFFQANFSNIGGMKGLASDNLRTIDAEISELKRLSSEIKNKMGALGDKNKGFLLSAEKFLSEELDKANAPLKFASTRNTFLVKGWIPKNNLSSALESLNKAAKNKIYIYSEDPKKNDKVPIKLHNPEPVRSFEFFMNLYTLPRYKEIDPTFFIFLTFPLLFGFMLGDFGYGLVTLILFFMLKKYIPSAKNFFNILIFASLSTIFFGLLFGEFFGLEQIGEFHLPHILSRTHQITELLYLAVGVGVFHINFGLVAGFFNELKSHGFLKALYAKGGWIILEIGIALLALSYFNLIALPTFVGVLFLLASFFMLYKGEGIKGLIEIPSIFSNTLSYARLMAIGLSSVKLAEVVNEMAGELFHSGGFFILIGIFILIVGHVVNMGIGMLGSFLHSLRLHYVEFFTKFFEGGGQRYSPFGVKNE